jgi:hypothetical protein
MGDDLDRLQRLTGAAILELLEQALTTLLRSAVELARLAVCTPEQRVELPRYTTLLDCLGTTSSPGTLASNLHHRCLRERPLKSGLRRFLGEFAGAETLPSFVLNDTHETSELVFTLMISREPHAVGR